MNQNQNFLLVGYNVIARRLTRRGGVRRWRPLSSALVSTFEEAMKLRDEYLQEHLHCLVDIIPLYTNKN